MLEEPIWEYDVFISYSRRDEEFVTFMEQSLKMSGLRCFRDVSGLGIFDKLDASLKAAIGRSRWLIAVISPAYLQSYWCLFEALEALQGQDLALRFLPVAAQYNVVDQTLDEDFVFECLADLREKIQILEGQIVRSRAYILSSKLDKLSFIQNYLPKIFLQMQERIFPVFKLWDEGAVRETMGSLLRYCGAVARVNLDAIVFDLGVLDAAPAIIPRLQNLPVLIWKADVGCQAWRNTPIVAGNDVIVASSGRHWNEPDDRDGVVCLHAETGKQKWFAPTPTDANSVLISKGLVLTGCDDGTVVAIRLFDGVEQWSINFQSAIVGGPIKLPSNIGNGKVNKFSAEVSDPVLIVTYLGQIIIIDLTTGRELDRIELGVSVLAAPLLIKTERQDRIVIPTESGEIIFIDYSSINVRIRKLHSVTIQYDDEHAQSGQSVPLLGSTPAFASGVIIQGFARKTYYRDPPIVALDERTGAIRWLARDFEGRGGGFGNIRIRPVVVNGEVIFTTAYSNELHAVSLETGDYLWSVPLGQAMYEHWSSPIVSSRSAFIGCHDGYLHKVSLERQQRDWSMYLGDVVRAGATVGAEQATPEFMDQSSWSAGTSSPILATPTIDRGRLYVGTQQGWLYCIGNLGEAV